jgi:hypothetical protein
MLDMKFNKLTGKIEEVQRPSQIDLGKEVDEVSEGSEYSYYEEDPYTPVTV